MTTPEARRLDLATGLAYNVLEWDADADHTVVLVHGFLDMAWGWERTVRSGLEGHFHIVAPDMRGHGDSDRIGSGGYYHFLDYIADLASVIDQLGRERVSLVGHSMGGSIAGYYSGVFPDSIHRLALLEGTGPAEGGPSADVRVRDWIASWKRVRQRSPKTYASIDEAAARLCKHDDRLPADFARELAEHGTPQTDSGLVFKHDSLHLNRGPYPFRVDYAEQMWPQIDCPVLLVEAANSGFQLPAEDRARRNAAFSSARTTTLPDAGHMMQRHQPLALAALLREFLSAPS